MNISKMLATVDKVENEPRMTRTYLNQTLLHLSPSPPQAAP